MEREELPPPPPLPRNGPQTEKLTIYMIIRGPTKGDSNNAPRTRLDSIREWDMDRSVQPAFKGTTVKFNEDDWTHIQRPQTDALVIRADIGGCNVERIFVDTASSVDVMYLDCFRRMNLAADIKPVGTSLFGFAGEEVRVYGKMQLPMLLGDGQWRQYRMVNFMLIDSPYQYNIIMGRPSLSEYAAIISTAPDDEIYSGRRKTKNCVDRRNLWRSASSKKMLCGLCSEFAIFKTNWGTKRRGR